MTPERADDLLARLLDGALGTDEHRELVVAAIQDPALGRRLADLLKIQPFLVDALAGAEGEEGFVNRIRHAMKDQSDTAFIRAVVQKAADAPADRPTGKPETRRRRTARRNPDDSSASPWALLLVAAGVLLVLGILIFSASDPAPRETVRRDLPRKTTSAQVPAEAERARAAAERKRLEDEVARIAEARRNAEAAEAKAKAERKEEDQRRAEADLRRIAEDQKAAEARLAKAHQEEQKAEEAVKAAAPDQAPRETKSVVARLERVEGDVQILIDGAWSPARNDQDLLEGQGIDTRGRSARTVVRYADKTKVELGGSTRIRRLTLEGGKRFSVEEGSLLAIVAKQPKERPMMIATAQGDATVVGTTLRILVDPDPRKGTRLDVEEGKVDLKNLLGKIVTVDSGHYAVSAAGTELVARRIAPPLLVEDFQDRRHVATEWDAIQGGLPLSYAGGRLEVDATPRSAEEYAATTWHTPGGLRTKKSFPLPLRIALEVDLSSNEYDVTPVLVLKPVGAAVGAGSVIYSSKDVLQVARRKDRVGAVVGTGSSEAEIKSAVLAYRPGETEHWTVEIGRETLVVSVNETEILREPHRLDPSRRYQIGLEVSAKKDIPAGIKARFDNIVIERADR